MTDFLDDATKARLAHCLDHYDTGSPQEADVKVLWQAYRAQATRLAVVDNLVTLSLYYRVLQSRGAIGTYGSRPIYYALGEALDALLADGSYAEAVAALDTPHTEAR